MNSLQNQNSGHNHAAGEEDRVREVLKKDREIEVMRVVVLMVVGCVVLCRIASR